MDLKKLYRETIDFLRSRKTNYTLTFMCPPGQAVLADLMRYCDATQTCYRDDPREHAKQEGRREVWLRIQYHLGLSSAQLFKLYNGGTINLEETDDA